MEFAEFIIWIKLCVFLPLTILLFFWVCCMVLREQIHIVYYTNLLISSIIQFSIFIFWKFKPGDSSYPAGIYMVALMVSLSFRMAIAIERCLVITRPQSNWIRHTGWSMLISLLVWIHCVITVSLGLAFHQIIPLFVFGLLPGPPFIFFSAWTFKALPAATSVPTDEKRRIVGALVLLFINYFLMILPTIISFAVALVSFHIFPFVFLYIISVLFQLSPFADLILFFFMRKGTVDKLLSCLCCCITDNTAEDVAGHQQLNELMLRKGERESEQNCV